MAAGVMAIQMGEHGRVSKGVFSKSGIFRLKKMLQSDFLESIRRKKRERDNSHLN